MFNVLQDENTLMRNQRREEFQLEAKEHSTRYREGHSEKLQLKLFPSLVSHKSILILKHIKHGFRWYLMIFSTIIFSCLEHNSIYLPYMHFIMPCLYSLIRYTNSYESPYLYFHHEALFCITFVCKKINRMC